MNCDVLVMGSGVGGSLLALILNQIGLKVVVIEKGQHPRFCIGESSTPIADMVLYDLSRQYDLPELAPLAKHGTLTKAYPQIASGLKRGFSYFSQQPGQPFETHHDHRNELLVTASFDDDDGDSHWLRSDLDYFFAEQLRARNIRLFEKTAITEIRQGPHWEVISEQPGIQKLTINARFIVDATGAAGVLLKSLGVKREPFGFRTNSYSIFGHFEGVQPWHEYLEETGSSTLDHPYRCDAAAVHHLLEEGWMWQLRFDNGVTSVGLVIDGSDQPSPSNSPEETWKRIIARYPSIDAQMAGAKRVAPKGGLVQTSWMQHMADRSADANWACLPNTAGFVDPLHSTGLAQTFCGIERLARIFSNDWGTARMEAGLVEYSRSLRNEFRFFDQLVSACFATRQNFRCFTAASMLYFAAATRFEDRRRQPKIDSQNDLFLCAGDSQLWTTVHCLAETAHQIASKGFPESEVQRFETTVARAISPFNTAGLCDPTAHNMYRYTAVKNKT